jgi:hypothetical protein
MTLEEKIIADQANSQLQPVGGFTNTFRGGVREALKDGEVLTIPENYVVIENRNLGSEGKHPQYINCPTNMGRIVELYPTMFTRTAFVVDNNCKPIMDGARQKRVPTGGSVAKFIAGKAIDPTMAAMKGCQIKFSAPQTYKTRRFGVDAETATSKDVVDMIIGNYDFVGDKKPEGYVAEG